jgi:hypothetical protein
MDFEKIFETVSLSIAGLLGLSYGISKFLKTKPQTDNYIAIHTEIHELLTELRVTGKCMRVSLMQFHNGEYFMDGISMRKFSITHESSHRGYLSQTLKFKNVLCSTFIPLLNKVVENRSLIWSVESMHDSFAKHFFEDENISHYSCLPVKNKNVNTGFVLVQWHEDFPPSLDEENALMDRFKAIRDSIEIQLSFQKN